MKTFFRTFFAAILLGSLFSASMADAQATGANRQAANRLWAVKDATAAQTFATTAYADLVAATAVVTPTFDPNQILAPGVPTTVDYIHVSYSMDVSKATATTGTCAAFVNGAVVAKTARTVNSAAGNVAMSGDFYIVNTTTGSQTVKLQCKSGDTNIFSVNNAHMIVEEIF
jgi:hypothetical protein